MAPASTFLFLEKSANVCPSYISFMCTLGAFQAAASVLSPPERLSSVLALLPSSSTGVKPCRFSKPDIMGTCLPSVGPYGQDCPVWDLIPSLLHACDGSPVCGYMHQGFGSWPCLHPSYPFNVGFSLGLAVEDLFCRSSDHFQS